MATKKNTQYDEDGNPKIGRPCITTDQKQRMETYSVKLSFKHAKMIDGVGMGIFSEGLREILEHVAKDMDFINKPRNKK